MLKAKFSFSARRVNTFWSSGTFFSCTNAGWKTLPVPLLNFVYLNTLGSVHSPGLSSSRCRSCSVHFGSLSVSMTITPFSALPIMSHIITTLFLTLPIQLLPAYLTPSSKPSGFLPGSWPHWKSILPSVVPV